jgi:hypothetical protein
MSQFLHELGSEAESNISGFNGKLPDGYWFDEGELIITKAPKLKQQNQDRGGFPSKMK